VRHACCATRDSSVIAFTNISMPRLHLLELHEQPWFPSSIRDEITDILQFGLNLLNAYGPVARLLTCALKSTRDNVIVDLCSGGGGPWLDLSRKVGDARALRICLTDKYPNLKAFKNAEAMSANITYFPESVDAANVPPELKGFRTIFTSFHHFSRKEAVAVLQSSVDAGQGIGIFEITRRAPSAVCLMILWALTPLVFSPFVRPFRASRLLWTYLIPIIPFVLLFDGVVSCLRTYRPAELSELTERLTGTAYRWETAEHWEGSTRPPVTYLIGYPRSHL
jgi:hypothetical protein